MRKYVNVKGEKKWEISALLQEDLETGMFSTDGAEMVAIIVWSGQDCWIGIRIRKILETFMLKPVFGNICISVALYVQFFKSRILTEIILCLTDKRKEIEEFQCQQYLLITRT